MIGRLLLAAALLLAQACALAQSSSSTVTPASGTTIALIRQSGTTLPATCSVGQLFFKTNATAGQNIYECASANTWTQQIGGTGTVPLTSAHLFVGSAGNVATDAPLSGDCSMANTGAITCTNSSGVAIATTSGTQTLTNKRVTPRVVTAADATSITPNIDTSDQINQANTQTLGTLTINAATGTPTPGQKLIIRVTSTNAHTLSFDTSYTGSTDLALPTTLSGASKADYLGFIYNSTSLKWNLVAKSFGY